MSTKLDISKKQEGDILSAQEFNAVVTAINENADSLDQAFEEIKSKFSGTKIQVGSNLIEINTVEDLIAYINEYGTAIDAYNTAPIIRLKQTTFIYKVGAELTLDIELFDAEGGELTLMGTNPSVLGGYTSFKLEKLRNGNNTINFNQMVYQDTTSKLSLGTYEFTDIYVVDKLGRSSISPINIKIIIGSISLTSLFDSTISYDKNESIAVRFGMSSIVNSHTVTFKTSGKMLVENEETGELEYKTFIDRVDKREEYKLADKDADFIVGQVYNNTYIINGGFSEVGDYTLTIQAEGEGEAEGVTSNSLSINIVVNEEGILYVSSPLDPNGSFYTGDTLDVIVNLYYTENPAYKYTYKCYAEVENLGISTESNESSDQKDILLKLALPDEYGSYKINYWAQIVTPVGEVYRTLTNSTVISLRNKSKYFVVTSPDSKLEISMTGKGKSNNSPTWETWENKYSLSQNYKGTLNNFLSSINGWEDRVDNNLHTGDSLKFTGEAYVDINYSPFANIDTNPNGLTIEFSIKTGALNGPGYYNLSIGRPQSYPLKGIFVEDNNIVIQGLNSLVTVPVISDKSVLTKMGEWIAGEEYVICAITFNNKTNECFVFINGIITGYSTYADPILLKQDSQILINTAINAQGELSGFSDTKIRYIRVYQTCLTPDQIVGNYIASYPDDVERSLLEDLNDTLNPVISRGYILGDRITGVDKDQPKLLIMNFVPGQEERIADTYLPRPEADGVYPQDWMDMRKDFPVDLDFQGNSSLSYPVKNYGIDIYDGAKWESNKVLESKDYFMVYNADKVEEYKPWISWDSFHLKANYIDSSHCNNLVMAKLAEQMMRMPWNWSTDAYREIFGTSTPFINYRVTSQDGSINSYSRFPVEPNRLAIDGFPFVLRGDYKDSNNQEFKEQFIGLYTWNLKQHRNLYSMQSDSGDPNRKYFIYRCESNGDSVHEQLRAGYCKCFNMAKETLYLDNLERVLTPAYINTKENQEMFSRYQQNDYEWISLYSTTGILQPNGKYTWVKFGTRVNDYGLKDNPIGCSYIAVLFDKDTSEKSNDPLDYSWYSINISEGLPYTNDNFVLIRYAETDYGQGMNGNVSGKTHIGLVWDVVKNYWQEGVDYFDKTGDAAEMEWRLGAEMIMDWECRNPKDLGRGHWEENINGVWTPTLDIVDPADKDHTSSVRKQLRWKWDDFRNGKAVRSGHTPLDYWTSILDDTYKIPSLNDETVTFSSIDKKKAKEASEQHVDFINACHWLADATDECIANPNIFNKYFELRSCIDYVIACIVFCLTDSVGRNFGMISWDDQFCPEPDENGYMYKDRTRFYPAFYDMDTAFGTNVQGGLYSTPYIEWPYDIMYKDTDGSWKYIYQAKQNAGQEYNNFNSLFFKRISKCYGKAIMRRYQELRGGTNDPNNQATQIKPVFNYLDIIKTYTKQVVGRIGERYFNDDAIYKYLGYVNDPDAVDKQTYFRNARGNKVMFMKSFLNKRMEYIDGLFQYVSDTEDMAYIQLYAAGTIELELETAIPGYIRISVALNQSTSVYCDGENPTKFIVTYPEETQHILRIYNCGIITKMRGLSGKDVRIARLNTMVSLQELDLSNNKNFGMEVSTVEIANCISLRKINFANCNGAKEFNFDISNCAMLEEFNIQNSSIKDISFFKNINLKRIDISECPNFKTLDISNLTKLETLNFDNNTIMSLNITNCNVPFDFSIKNSYNSLTKLVIVNNPYIEKLQFDPSSFAVLNDLEIYNCQNLRECTELFKGRRKGKITLNLNFLGRCPRLTDISGLFEDSNIDELPQNMLIESNNIRTIDRIFKDCSNLTRVSVLFDDLVRLESAVSAFENAVLERYEDVIGEDQYGETVVIGKKAVSFLPNTFMSNVPNLKICTSMFRGAHLSTMPNTMLLSSKKITHAKFMFADIVNTNSVFNGTTLGLIINNYLFSPLYTIDLITAEGLFQNTKISGQIPSSFFMNTPALVNSSNLLENTLVTNLPDGFFSMSPKLVSYDNMLNGTNITKLNLGFFKAVTSIKKPLLTEIIGYNSPCKDINYDFLSECLALEDVSELFDNTLIEVLPEGFLSYYYPKLTITRGMFKSNTKLRHVNSDLFKQCPSMVELSGFLSQWDLNPETNRSVCPLITIAEGWLSWDNNIEVINGFFAGCCIEEIPTDFLKGCKKLRIANIFNLVNYWTSDITGKKYTLKSIKNFFTWDLPELVDAGLTDRSGIDIVPLPEGFMSNAPKLKKLQFYLGFDGTDIYNIDFLQNSPLLESLTVNYANYPDNFLSDKNNLTTLNIRRPKTIGNNFCINFKGTTIHTNATDQLVSIGDNFLKNSTTFNDLTSFLKDTLLNTTYIGPGFLENAPCGIYADSFRNCKLSRFPEGFMKSNKLSSFSFKSLLGSNMNNIIPNLNFMENNPNLTTLEGMFDQTGILEIPDNFLKDNNTVNSIGKWDNTSIRKIGNNFLRYNEKILNLSEAFKDSPIEEIGDDCLSNCCNIDIPIGQDQWGEPIYPEYSSSQAMFEESSIRKIGINFLRYSTFIEDIFDKCRNLESIGDGFYSLETNCLGYNGAFAATSLRNMPTGFMSRVKGITSFKFMDLLKTEQLFKDYSGSRAIASNNYVLNVNIGKYIYYLPYNNVPMLIVNSEDNSVKEVVVPYQNTYGAYYHEENSKLYIGSRLGNFLVIVDVSDPINPTFTKKDITNTGVTNFECIDIQLFGENLFFGCNSPKYISYVPMEDLDGDGSSIEITKLFENEPTGNGWSQSGVVRIRNMIVVSNKLYCIPLYNNDGLRPCVIYLSRNVYVKDTLPLLNFGEKTSNTNIYGSFLYKNSIYIMHQKFSGVDDEYLNKLDLATGAMSRVKFDYSGGLYNSWAFKLVGNKLYHAIDSFLIESNLDTLEQKIIFDTSSSYATFRARIAINDNKLYHIPNTTDLKWNMVDLRDFSQITYVNNDFLRASNSSLITLTNLFKSTLIKGIHGKSDNEDNFLENCENVTNIGTCAHQSNLAYIPSTLFRRCNKLTNLSYLFEYSTILEIEEDFLSELTNITTVYATFVRNYFLRTFPTNFLKNYSKITNIGVCFEYSSKMRGSIPKGYLANAPELSSCASFLNGCSLFESTIPDDFLLSSKKLTTVASMFYNTRVYGVIPDGFLSNLPGLTNASAIFGGTRIDGNIPASFLADCPSITSISSLLRNIKNTINIEDGFLSSCKDSLLNIDSLFMDSVVGYIPEFLFLDLPNVTAASNFLRSATITLDLPPLFVNFPKLTTALYVFYYSNILANINVVFKNCPLLSDVRECFYMSESSIETPLIPGSFEGCPNVESARYLFARSRISGIVPKMFSGNNKLNSIERMFWQSRISGFEEGWWENLAGVDENYLGGNLILREWKDFSYMFLNTNISEMVDLGKIFTGITTLRECYGGTQLTTVNINYLNNCKHSLVNADYIFQGCKIKHFPDDMFNGFPLLESAYRITNTILYLETIGNRVFYDCPLLKVGNHAGGNSLTIWNGGSHAEYPLKSIGDDCWGKCPSLCMNVYLRNDKGTITIGDRFGKDSRSIIIDSGWYDANTRFIIGDDFLMNTDLSDMDGGLLMTFFPIEVGNNFMRNSKCLYFYNCGYAFGHFQKVGDNCFMDCSNAELLAKNYSNGLSFPNLVEIGTGFMKNCSKFRSYVNFRNNINLLLIPEDFMEGCTSITTMENMFNGCKNLISGIPENFMQDNKITNFNSAFYNCEGYTGTFPNYWVTHPTASSTNTFYNCKRAANYYEIPKSWGGGLEGLLVDQEEYDALLSRVARLEQLIIDLSNDKK